MWNRAQISQTGMNFDVSYVYFKNILDEDTGEKLFTARRYGEYIIAPRSIGVELAYQYWSLVFGFVKMVLWKIDA